MHVRVRLSGKPEAIVVIESKLTKIDEFRRVLRDKFGIHPKLQRLFYGGKLLENGYTFHDYNIKLNDVVQLMVREQLPEESFVQEDTVKGQEKEDSENVIVYKDAVSKLYAIGDLIDMRDSQQGAWHEGEIVNIVYDPKYEEIVDTSVQEEVNSSESEPGQNKPDQIESTNDKTKTSSKKNSISNYFRKIENLKKKSASENRSLIEDKELHLLYKIHLESDDSDSKVDHYCKIQDIRPRSRFEISIEDLKVGDKVLVNHNTEDLLEKGYWYDFKVSEIKKLRKNYELIGTVYYGPDAIPKNNTKVRVIDKIYAIEKMVPLALRTKEQNKLMITPTERRSSPLNCLTCRDDEDANCRDCGCFICAEKRDPEKIILCDDCNKGFHMDCLSPPLTSIPEEDWYCPSCKRDPNEVIAPGAGKQAKKNMPKTKRDWGRGMACVGKTKTSAMPANHFGPIPGIEVGMCWRFRIQLSESGVHRPPVSGIHGRDVEGAYSIVLSGGYEDDYDDGDEFTYTGSGGRDLSGNKRTAEQSCDQTLTRENKALARNCAAGKVSEEGGDAGANWREGRPVRVVRSFKMKKHFPQYAPSEGIRYDGIYKVVKYYPETGKSGFRVWKYQLRRDDPSPAPWEPGAKQFDIVYPDGYLEAEAEKLLQKEKAKNTKSGKKAKKRVLQPSNSSNSDSDSEDELPKKRKKMTKKQDKDEKTRETRKSKTAEPKSPKHKKIDTFITTKASPKNKENQKVDINQLLSKEELEAINSDTTNTKLWEECLDVCKSSGKKEFIEHITEVFLCIICQDVVTSPVTTSCLHNFCMGCIKRAFRSTSTKTCPYCRNDLSKEELQHNENLKTALQTIMPGYDVGKK